MLLQCININKSFSDKPILKNVSFNLEEKEKAAIVGINGAGKSTLLKLITGELDSDGGEIVTRSGATIGYLSQLEAVTGSNTIYREVMSARDEINVLWDRIRELEDAMKHLSGTELEQTMERYDRMRFEFEEKNGYALVSEVTGVLRGLGFTDQEFEKKVSSLSGGEKTRVALSKLLLKKPDLIILDEPTNHLDMDSITWLEGYIREYPGAVLVVAHDRYFLDRTVTKIIELENSLCSVFKGNYSQYAEKKDARFKEALRLYIKQQAEIAHQEAVIKKLKSFNREKSIKRAESREKMLDKIERVEKPVTPADSMRISITPRIESGRDVLRVENLSKSYGERTLFSDLDMNIQRGERVAIIGKNGTGKTTILKIINEMLDADTGLVTLGTKVHIGYYDQEQQVLSPEKTLFSELQDAYPDLDNTTVRNTLAAFLFTGDDVFKLVKDLSGGERGRLSLAKLMLSEANFLILDEPTNHLDMVSKEILENAVNSYTGTVLYVSHDRYFINKTATRIRELTDGKLTNCEGDYDYYLEKRDDLLRAIGVTTAEEKKAENSGPGEAALDYAAQKAEKARLKKKENDVKKCEEKIAETEEAISLLKEQMADPSISTNAARLTELSTQLTEAEDELASLMELWEQLFEL